MKNALRIVIALPIAAALGYSAAYAYLRSSLPEFEIRGVEADVAARERDPQPSFFGLMAPMPKLEGFTYVPKLEYRQGPPKRYLSKLTYLVVGDNDEAKEHIEFYGRRTLDDRFVAWSEKLTRAENWSYPSFVLSALRYAKNGEWPAGVSTAAKPLASLLFLAQAKRLLGRETTDVYVMDQAGIPAFLFYPRYRTSLGEEARIHFYRRNMLYEVEMRSTGKFSALHPLEFFRKSFLVETRQDAMAFVASELSEVKLASTNLDKLAFRDLEWPLLLLGSKLSVDPSSIHAFFHFAGLNALLFREHGQKSKDLELVDSLRNNVLVSDRYGRDVAPESQQSAEMGRLARALVQMLQ